MARTAIAPDVRQQNEWRYRSPLAELEEASHNAARKLFTLTLFTYCCRVKRRFSAEKAVF